MTKSNFFDESILKQFEDTEQNDTLTLKKIQEKANAIKGKIQNKSIQTPSPFWEGLGTEL